MMITTIDNITNVKITTHTGIGTEGETILDLTLWGDEGVVQCRMRSQDAIRTLQEGLNNLLDESKVRQ